MMQMVNGQVECAGDHLLAGTAPAVFVGEKNSCNEHTERRRFSMMVSRIC